MKLTKLQNKTLQQLHSFRSKPPTVGRQLSLNWFAWLALLFVVVLGCLVFLMPGFETVGWLWIGIAVGAFLRDIGRFRATVRVWPIYQEIINWPKVAELLDVQQIPEAQRKS